MMEPGLLEPRSLELDDDAWINFIKTLHESRVSDNTRKTDRELRAPVVAGVRYAFRIFVSALTTNNTPDFQIELDGPASPRFYNSEWRYLTFAGTYTTAVHTALNTAIAFTGNAGRAFIEIHGIIECIAGGELSVKWAQNTSDANPTTVLAGSFISLLPLPF